MQFSYFTERPYRGVDEDEVLKNRAFFALPNEQFDREIAANDFNYYLDENCYAEELGRAFYFRLGAVYAQPELAAFAARSEKRANAADPRLSR